MKSNNGRNRLGFDKPSCILFDPEAVNARFKCFDFIWRAKGVICFLGSVLSPYIHRSDCFEVVDLPP